jgi:sodium-dependent dicarboxylate transporter 2/3/5
MGSITATPANGILVTYAVLNDIPGTQYLSFASWLGWGIPLVIIFVSIAGVIISLVLRPWRYQQHSIQLPFDAAKTYHPFQKISVWMTVIYFLSSFILSLLMMYFAGRTSLILLISGILTLLFMLFLFFIPVRVESKTDSRQVLLTLADCYSDLPIRGFIFVGIAVVLAAILYAFKIHEFFAGWAAWVIPTDISVYALFFLIALATSFSTEVLSNTAVQLSFFVVALPLAQTLGLPALEMLIIITLSCTSAFMSPIATGVNGLAFGGVKGVSFSKMLVAGFILNIAGALLISSWVLIVVERLYGLMQ